MRSTETIIAAITTPTQRLSRRPCAVQKPKSHATRVALVTGAASGVDEEDLGAFYAQRTIPKREVLPKHVAAAVAVLTGGSGEGCADD